MRLTKKQRRWIAYGIVAILAISLLGEMPLFATSAYAMLGIGWWLFSYKTDCGVQTEHTERCAHPARGILRGCKCHRSHGRAKARAVLRVFRIPYLPNLFNPTWRLGSQDLDVSPSFSRVTSPVSPEFHPQFLTIASLIVGIVSALATVAQVIIALNR